MRRRRAYCKLSDYPAVILPSLLSSHCHSHGYVRGSRSAMYGSPHRQIYSTRRTSRVPQHLPRRHGCHKINSFCVRTPRDGPYFLFLLAWAQQPSRIIPFFASSISYLSYPSVCMAPRNLPKSFSTTFPLREPLS